MGDRRRRKLTRARVRKHRELTLAAERPILLDSSSSSDEYEGINKLQNKMISNQRGWTQWEFKINVTFEILFIE